MCSCSTPFEPPATFEGCCLQHNQFSFYNVFPACRGMTFLNIYVTNQELFDRYIQITTFFYCLSPKHTQTHVIFELWTAWTEGLTCRGQVLLLQEYILSSLTWQKYKDKAFCKVTSLYIYMCINCVCLCVSK